MKRKIYSFTFIVVVFWGFVSHLLRILLRKNEFDGECRLIPKSGVSFFLTIPETTSFLFLFYDQKMTCGQFSQNGILARMNSSILKIA